jgi:hypothetical protein
VVYSKKPTKIEMVADTKRRRECSRMTQTEGNCAGYCSGCRIKGMAMGWTCSLKQSSVKVECLNGISASTVYFAERCGAVSRGSEHFCWVWFKLVALSDMSGRSHSSVDWKKIQWNFCWVPDRLLIGVVIREFGRSIRSSLWVRGVIRTPMISVVAVEAVYVALRDRRSLLDVVLWFVTKVMRLMLWFW